jgi:radical SAM superfamily enzyme YgiQ (UPF0313 family)
MKKIKILLIQPPLHELSIVFGIMEPYALKVLSTSIQNEKTFKGLTETKIFDLRVEPINHLINLLKSGNIDIIGITGIIIDQPKIIEISDLIKKLSPKTLIVVGGHHATMLSEDFFVTNIDLIVRGPGHKVFLEIIEKKLFGPEDYSNIHGVIQNTGANNFIECSGWKKNINEAPPAPLRNITKKRYRCFGHRINVVTTAQGCSGRCSFCACWPAMNGKYITKSPTQVFKEIKSCREKWIFLGDDNTFQDIDRMMRVAELLSSSTTRKFFDGYCRADIIVNHPELIEAWSNIGLKYLTVGFEAINKDNLDNLNKKSSIETNEEANRILQKLGVINLAHILIRPDFTTSDFQNIKDYIYKHNIVEPVFPILTPLPGTILWKKYKKQVANIPRQFFDLAHPLLENKTWH